MTTKKQQKEEQRANAIQALRDLLDEQPAKNIKGIVTSVSASGMTRRIRFFTVDMTATEYNRETGEHFNAPRVIEVTHLIGRILEDNVNDNGLKVTGCGMDMIFHTVYNVSRILYRDNDNRSDNDAGYLIGYR
jgi:hypothetical protein